MGGVLREAIEAVLPGDLPTRATVVEKSALHLMRVLEVNQTMNLTRIVDPREAALKHVLDSVLPWPLLKAAHSVLDMGSGAGYPGIPLALVLPDVRFTLAESVHKKARFLDKVVREIELRNVAVRAERGESILRKHRFDVVVVRAVGAIDKVLALFHPVKTRLERLLFYKGPNAETELSAAAPLLVELGLKAGIIHRYDLPDDSGRRCIVEVKT